MNTQQTNKQTNKQTHRSLITTYIFHTFITIGTPALHFLDNYILLTFITLQQTNNWHTGITLPLHITTNTPSYIDTPVLDNYMCIYYQLAHRHYIVIVIVIIVIIVAIIVIVFLLVRSCPFIALITCLKGHKSLRVLYGSVFQQ